VDTPRFDFFGNDFGWGKPIAVRNEVGLERNFGRVIVLGGAEEGSIDIEVCLPYDIDIEDCLPHDILEAMGSDHRSMNAMCV